MTTPTALFQSHTRAIFAFVTLTGLLVLSGCGGGGGGGGAVISPPPPAPPAPPPTYSIGGTITGLSTSGLVLASGQTTLPIKSNQATFTFPTEVISGTAYNVTIQTQPTNESCTITSGNGTVSGANVTNIQVSCSPAVGSGVGWIPYISEQSGLFLVQSGSIPNSPVSGIAGAPVQVLGASQYWSIAGGSISGNYWDSELLIAALSTDGNVHLFTVNLTNAVTTTPTPTQVGTLSLTSINQLCDWQTAQTSLSDPNTGFAVIHVAAAGTSCGSNTDTWQLAHFSDAAGVAPMPLSIKQTAFFPVYAATGTLARIVQYDGSSNVYVYSDNTFSSPTTLASGVQALVPMIDYYVNDSGYVGDTWFLSAENVSAGTVDLWRVPATGTASKVYTSSLNSVSGQGLGTSGAAGGAVTDSSNIYFLDSAKSEIMELSATQTAPSAVALCAFPGGASDPPLLAGSNNTDLVFWTPPTSPGFPAAHGDTTTLTYVLANGPAGQTPTQLWGNGTVPGQYTNAGLFAFMATPSPGDYAGAALFVSFINFNTGVNSANPWSAQMQPLNKSLSATPTTTNNSAYIPTNSLTLGGQSVGNLIQVLNIPTTNSYSDMGGGSLYNITPTAASPLTVAGGSAYTLPTGTNPYSFFGTELQPNFFIQPTSGSSAVGTGSTSSTGILTENVGTTPFALNWFTNTIQTITSPSGLAPALPVSNYSPYYFPGE